MIFFIFFPLLRFMSGFKLIWAAQDVGKTGDSFVCETLVISTSDLLGMKPNKQIEKTIQNLIQSTVSLSMSIQISRGDVPYLVMDHHGSSWNHESAYFNESAGYNHYHEIDTVRSFKWINNIKRHKEEQCRIIHTLDTHRGKQNTWHHPIQIYSAAHDPTKHDIKQTHLGFSKIWVPSIQWLIFIFSHSNGYFLTQGHPVGGVHPSWLSSEASGRWCTC